MASQTGLQLKDLFLVMIQLPTILLDINKVINSVPHDLLLEQIWKCGLTGSLWWLLPLWLLSVCPGGGSVVWLASSVLRGPAGKHSRSLVIHYPCMSDYPSMFPLPLSCFPMIPKSSGGPDLSPLLRIVVTSSWHPLVASSNAWSSDTGLCFNALKSMLQVL